MNVLSWMGEHWFLSLVFGSFAFALVHSIISGFFRVLLGLVNRGGAQPAPGNDEEEEEEEEQETAPTTTEVTADAKPSKVKRRSLWERLRDDDA